MPGNCANTKFDAPKPLALEWHPEIKAEIDRKLLALKPFDPYNSSLCTCPPKLTLNVYNGCGNECFYCYASAYSRGRWGYHAETWGVRRDILQNLERDIRLINSGEDDLLARLRGFFVVVSLSSDPYPNTPRVKEAELRVTRQCLNLLTRSGFRILIQTKSSLITRDLDVLDRAKTVIGLTITTPNDNLAAKMEPHAPPPSERIEALRRCASAGFVTICRVDPIIPRLNDDEESLEQLISRLADAGVRQIISSTYKKKPDNAARFEERFSRIARATQSLYETRRTEGYQYLRRKYRIEILERVRRIAERHGLPFSVCREGLKLSSATVCDGRQLLQDER